MKEDFFNHESLDPTLELKKYLDLIVARALELETKLNSYMIKVDCYARNYMAFCRHGDRFRICVKVDPGTPNRGHLFMN